MSKEIITVLGPTKVEIDNHTGNNVDLIQLQEQIELGEKTGNIYWDGYVVPIGNFRVVNEEAEKWKECAKKFYKAAKTMTKEVQINLMSKAKKEYEQLIKEGE